MPLKRRKYDAISPKKKNDNIIAVINSLEHHAIPDGYRLIVEEYTGRHRLIFCEATTKLFIPKINFFLHSCQGELMVIPSNDIFHANSQNSQNHLAESDQTIPQTQIDNATATTDTDETTFFDEFILDDTLSLENEKMDDGWFKKILNFDSTSLQSSSIHSMKLRETADDEHSLCEAVDRQTRITETDNSTHADSLPNISREKTLESDQSLGSNVCNYETFKESFENLNLFADNCVFVLFAYAQLNRFLYVPLLFEI
jgi:hypothetical protein